MNIRNTYWMISLSIVLSFSLVLPICCNANVSELFSHHQEMPNHAMHGQQSDAEQCDCGHELVKDYQKTKKVVNSQPQLLFSAVASPTAVSFSFDTDFRSISAQIQPGIISNSGPPLHLLNSVFLN